MLGAIVGDILGSAYEFDNPKEPDYPFIRKHWNRLKTSKPTDDSICTCAITESILTNKLDFADSLRRWGRKYKDTDFGTMYTNWLMDDNAQAYNSWGNGSVMRVSACALLAVDDVQALQLAELQSSVTHNHPNSIHASKALVTAIRMGMRGYSREDIKKAMTDIFGYDLSLSYDELKLVNNSIFDLSAGGTLRLALTAVLNAVTFEDAMRKCIDFGGDTDTTAAVGGPLAEVLFQIPKDIVDQCYTLMDADMMNLLDSEYKDPRATLSFNSTGEFKFDESGVHFTPENKALLTGNMTYLKR